MVSKLAAMPPQTVPTRLQAGSAVQYKAMGIATPAQELFTNADPSLLQWGNYTYVIELASRVLERQPDNVKLLYRRGVAHLEKNEFGESKVDLVEAHRLDPTNKAINEKLGQLRVREKRHVEELSKGLKKMFG